MKLIRLSYLILSASVLFVACQPAAEAPPAVDMGAETEVISGLVQTMFEHIAAQDFDAMAGIVSDDFALVNMGQPASLEENREWFAEHIKDHTINISGVQVKLSRDGSMAAVTCDENTSYSFDGAPLASQDARFLITLLRGDAGWRIDKVNRSAGPATPVE